MRNRRLTEPHVVHLPRNTVNLGHRYDWKIVSQGRVVSTYAGAQAVIRSSAPFVVRATLTNGKTRDMHSRIQ